MDEAELRKFLHHTLDSSPENETANVEWDSLEKLAIISALHDKFGSSVSNIDGLDNFDDFEGLLRILRDNNIVS